MKGLTMWNTPSVDDLKRLGIPMLYETEKTHIEDKLIYLHFFLGNCDWFVSEWDEDDLFFGYANLGDYQCAEWGYISFTELKSLRIVYGIEVDFDMHWQIRRASEVEKIIFR